MILNSVVLDLNAGSWKQAFEQITEQASYHTPLKARDLYEHLTDMEREHPSGVGGGIAIPHSVVEMLNDPYLLIARSNQKIQMNTVDNEPVDIFALLLSPQSDGGIHLQRLSRITRLLQSSDTKTALRGAAAENQIYSLIGHPLALQQDAA